MSELVSVWGSLPTFLKMVICLTAGLSLFKVLGMIFSPKRKMPPSDSFFVDFSDSDSDQEMDLKCGPVSTDNIEKVHIVVDESVPDADVEELKKIVEEISDDTSLEVRSATLEVDEKVSGETWDNNEHRESGKALTYTKMGDLESKVPKKDPYEDPNRNTLMYPDHIDQQMFREHFTPHGASRSEEVEAPEKEDAKMSQDVFEDDPMVDPDKPATRAPEPTLDQILSLMPTDLTKTFSDERIRSWFRPVARFFSLQTVEAIHARKRAVEDGRDKALVSFLQEMLEYEDEGHVSISDIGTALKKVRNQ